MTELPHFNIVFATPANSFTPGYLSSLLTSISAIEKEGLTWTIVSHGGSLVAMARENTIAGLDTDNPNVVKPHNGKFTYDKIIWIDSDISWSPADLFRLYKSEKDIISGCYLMQDRTIPIYSQPRGIPMPETVIDEFIEPFTVAGCGFGFVAVKQGVFETIPRPWFGPEPIPDGNGGETLILIGEDVSWCTKAIKHGFEIWVDPMVRVVHQKEFKIDWKNK